jgi:nitroimidazol reductase NimA-like FMN-containing flavoprotein (pyridoxamine 5'-phosphate oxidase superfamily)
MENEETKVKVIQHMKDHYNATIATSRENKPHASTVSYVNDGLTIYFGTGEKSLKTEDIRTNPEVALTIYKDYSDLLETKGLEYTGKAEIVEDSTETQRAIDLLMAKFPSYKSIMSEEVLAMFPSHKAVESGKLGVVIIKVTPKWIRYADAREGYETLSF